ncbi:recombinase family protein [Cellulomonas sp. NPDC057328]|uniref:recombinase family protein n=1 Tax=Cellulomonas sp. NPDC057328 TaxID=3346101 RepID=UPI0036407272
MLLGYARVSTTQQTVDAQIDALIAAGVEPTAIWQERMSAAYRNRPQLEAVLAYAREGDTIIVWKLDRLARNLRDALNIIGELRERGIAVRTLADPVTIDTGDTSPMGQFAVQLIAMLAELERNTIKERTSVARAAAVARGNPPGRKRALTPEDVDRATYLRDVKGWSYPRLAKEFGCSRATLYAWLPRPFEPSEDTDTPAPERPPRAEERSK